MSIALFFGSFNPIHIGHLIIGQSILRHPDIEKVWFVVSPQNPFKKSQQLLHENHRYYLAQIATEDNSDFYVSNIEFSMPKPSYTIDTLMYLKEKYPTKEFSLLIGGDNLESFSKWKNHESILENYKIFVYNRPEVDQNELLKHKNIELLDVPLLEISSTEIRKLIKERNSIKYLVPENVIMEIEKGGFYIQEK